MHDIYCDVKSVLYWHTGARFPLLVGVVPLAVINDNDDEDDETLTASLTLPVQSLSNQRVLLVPNTTIMTVLQQLEYHRYCIRLIYY